MFASLESHIAAFAANEEEAIKAKFAELVDYIRGEESKIAAAIERLKKHGYTVTAPETVVPNVPQAPEAAAGGA